jgi:hypothetical protein
LGKKSSIIRKKIFEQLFQEMKERDNSLQLSNVRVYKGVQYFCIYLANYTEIKHIDEICKIVVEDFFQYLLNNQKRNGMSLSDMKKTISAIQEITNVSSCEHLFDFSLSNLSLWSKLK